MITLDRGQAAYLLLNFPALSEWAENMREDILHGYRQTACAGGNRGSGHSDPTAGKAERLISCQHIAELMTDVSRWIDTELEPHDRPVLIEFWRLRHLGLYWVARSLDMEVWRCMDRWSIIINNLLSHLKKKQYAGHAFVLPGGASADGLKRASPAW